MRLLADYVLRTRTGEVPVSTPLREGHPTRVTMGFAAQDTDLVRHLAGQEAVLVRNIERPGEALARLRLVAVDLASSLLVAELVGTRPSEPARPEVDPGTSPGRPPVRREVDPGTTPARPPRARTAVLTAGAVLGLIVLGALGVTVYSRADRSCTSSMDCPDGFTCAVWGNPAPGEHEYRSCERECRGDRDCPGSEVCVHVREDVRVCRANR